MNFKQKLRIVWNNNPPKRYLPQSLDGGTGWGVFDDKEKRFLSDREVKRTPADALAAERVTH